MSAWRTRGTRTLGTAVAGVVAAAVLLPGLRPPPAQAAAPTAQAAAASGGARPDSRTPLLALPTDEGVGLRWVWPAAGAPAVGYHVERQALGGDWRRLTTRPIARVGDPTEARRRLGAAYDRYGPLLFPPEPVRSRGEAESYRGLLLLSADLDPAVANALGLRYDDAAVEPGRAYRYRLVAVDEAGERIVATSGAVVAGEYAPAPPPDTVDAAQVGNSVVLRWSLRIPFSGYNVYRDGRRLNDGPVVVFRDAGGSGARSSPFQFRDTAVVAGDTVRYAVEGIDALGRAGRRSAPVTLVVRDRVPPRPPPVVRTAVRGDTVHVYWEPSPDPDVVGYQLWRADAREGPFAEVGEPVPGARSDRSDPGRSGGRTLWYRVTALDAAGNESAPSFTALAAVPDLQPPPAPQGVEGTADAGLARLRWRPVGSPDLRGYRVYRASTPDREFGLLTPRPIPEAAFVDTLRTGADHAFHYRVTAVDSAYNESEPGETVAVRPPDVTAPRAPIIAAVEAGEERLVVRWLPNPDADVVGYRVRYRIRGEREWSELPEHLPRDARADTVPGVPARTPVEVAVLAIDDAGNVSPPSRTVTGEAYKRRPPPVPPLERATFVADSGFVRLRWAAPAAGVVRIVVLRRRSDGVRFRALGAVEPGARGYIDRPVGTGATYEYALRVFDRYGNHADSPHPVRVAVPDGPQ